MANMSQLPQVVKYAHGTQRYWIEHHTIGVLVVAGPGRLEMVEAAQAVKDMMAEAPDPKHLFTITHAENLHSLTPAMRHVINEFFDHLPEDIVMTSAIVLRDSLLHSLLGLFLNGVRRLTKAHLNYQIFRDEASAIEWLKSMQIAAAKAS